MRKSSITTKQAQQSATKHSEPLLQPAKPGASHPANWLQLSFELNVPTWQQEMKQRRKAK